MATSPDRDSKRRSGATAPEQAKEKPVPLTWEEEELVAYEPKRVKALEEKRRAEAKVALLARQLPFQWKALREILKIRCESLNTKAGRTILRTVEPDNYHLEIRREDDSKIDIQFDLEKKKVTFTGKALVYDREYELIVQSYNNVDSTVWYSHATLANEQPDDLAKSMIGNLLRAEQ